MNDTGFALRVERVGPPGVTAVPTLVLLPAAATTADDFVREGFIDDLDALGIDATVFSAAVPVDVYAADRVVALVKAQIGTTAGAPASIWFVGVSLGGMTALACAEAHRSAVAGVFAIAPWPGPRGLWNDIPAIGLAAWAVRQREARFDDERRVWRWLGEGADGGPQVMIGYGRGDRFAEGQQLLASAAPPAHRFVIDGAHDWPTWKALWRAFLRRQRRWHNAAPASERRGAPDVRR